MDKPPNLPEWATEFHDHLENEELSPKSIISYKRNLNAFLKWARLTGLRDVEEITTRQIRAFLAYRKRECGCKDTTRSVEQITLNKFIRFIMEEDPSVFEQNPMDSVKRIRPKKQFAEFTSDDDIAKLLDTCREDNFRNVRDRALIMLFCDTGARAAEVIVPKARMHLDDLYIHIIGKGNKEREVPFTEATAANIEEYYRWREDHSHADSPMVWLGKWGPMKYPGVYHAVTSRCKLAHIEHHHPHELRHYFVHSWKEKGGSDDSLMELTGWETYEMLRLYARSQRQKRARDEYRRMMK